MKRIGTVTLQYPYNYGSTFQAFALQKVVEGLGYKSEIIDYTCNYDFENYKIFRTKQYKSRPKTLAADILYLRKNIQRKRAFRNFQEKFLVVTPKKYENIDDLYELNNVMSGFIAGSDQIWNFECTGGVDPVYFLSFVNGKNKKIAYAPSMGQGGQKDSDLKKIQPMLQQFDALSIRENSMKETLENLTGRKFKTVLDPTLLLNKSDYLPLIRDQVKGSYIFVYMLEPNKELIEYATKLAKYKHMKLVYISNITKKKIFESVDSNNLYGVGPDIFLTELINAEYVITNSFHATVFSIIFQKKFSTFRTKKSYPRMIDLLSSLSLLDRIMNPKFDIDNQINFEVVNEKLKNLKKVSISFLKDALSTVE